MERKIKRLERFCIAGIAVLSVVAAAGAILLLSPHDAAETGDPSARPVQMSQAALDEPLAEPADYLPDAVYYGKKLPVTVFQTEDGAGYDLASRTGKKLILMFWGTWCPYCEEALEYCAEYEAVLGEYPDYELILIDKLDPEHGESVEKASGYLAQREIPFLCLYDKDLIAYEAFGVKRIPTLLVLDENGYLRAMTASPLSGGSELRELLRYAESGGAANTERFVAEYMTGEDGGIYTNYLDKGGDSPAGRDVLSESQGVIMEYAVLTDNPELFAGSWRFAREKLYRDGVFSWYVTADGKQAQANALIDDLRIYRALKEADRLWGGYEAEWKALAQAVYGRNAAGGHLAGFYDFQMKRGGTTLPLFYIDLEALQSMAEEVEGFSGAVEEAREILRGGYIGDGFPLYYSSYDHQSGEYAEDSLNTAEALVTLYQAVKAGVARQESLDWLEERAVSGTLAARYTIDGRVVDGFDYDSTAVYAIAALIGSEAGNARLYTGARNRMEKYYVTERTDLQGSFSDKADGSDIFSFDQLTALLVYGGANRIVFDN